MPAPADFQYSTAAYIAAHQALLDLIDGQVQAGFIRYLSASDIVIAISRLTDPGGTVDGGTGALSLTVAQSFTATADGAIAYAQITDGALNPVLELPAVQGSVPVSGRVVVSSLNVTAGATVDLVSAVIGG